MLDALRSGFCNQTKPFDRWLLLGPYVAVFVCLLGIIAVGFLARDEEGFPKAESGGLGVALVVLLVAVPMIISSLPLFIVWQKIKSMGSKLAIAMLFSGAHFVSQLWYEPSGSGGPHVDKALLACIAIGVLLLVLSAIVAEDTRKQGS